MPRLAALLLAILLGTLLGACATAPEAPAVSSAAVRSWAHSSLGRLGATGNAAGRAPTPASRTASATRRSCRLSPQGVRACFSDRFHNRSHPSRVSGAA